MRFELITIPFTGMEYIFCPQLLMICEWEQPTNGVNRRFKVCFPFPSIETLANAAK